MSLKSPSEHASSYFIFDACDHAPIQYETFDALAIYPHQFEERDGICKCGKAAMDGIRCRLGGSHKSLAMYKAELAIGDFF